MTHQEPSLPASEIRAVFRRASAEHHPVLRRHTRDDVCDGGRLMAPGGLLLASHVFDVSVCREVAGGDVLWEDDVLYRGDRAGWSDDYLVRSRWLIRHILHGRKHQPALTHMLLAATRRHDASVSSSTDSPVLT